MTIGVEDRQAAIKRALVRLADLCGDASGIRFGAADLVEASPLGTTVSELEEARVVKTGRVLVERRAVRLDHGGLVPGAADLGAVRLRGIPPTVRPALCRDEARRGRTPGHGLGRLPEDPRRAR